MAAEHDVEDGSRDSQGTTIVSPTVFAVGCAAMLLALFLGFTEVSANGVACGTAISPTTPFPGRAPHGVGLDVDAALNENVARSVINADCAEAANSRRFMAIGSGGLGVFLLWYGTREHAPALFGRKQEGQ